MKAEREVEGAVEIDIEDELERLKRKSTRMEAVARIGEAGAVEAVVPLLRLCKRGKKREQAAICEALVKIGEPSIRLLVEHGLEDKNAQVRECAARALGLIGQTGLAVTSQSVVARLAFDALLRCLTDESARVRLASAAALGEWRDPAAAQALVALLGDEDRKVRDQAAEALGELGAGAGEAVHEALEREESLHVQIAAAEALGEIGDAAAIASLRGVLADPSAAEELRVTAMAALAEALGEGVVPLASAVLAEGDAQVRRQAVRSLSAVETPESTAQLMALYADDDKKVRHWALQGLQARRQELLCRVATGETDVLPALLAAWRALGKKQREEAQEIERGLVQIGTDLVPSLVEALDPTRPGADIIGVLGAMGPAASEAYRALVAQLDNVDLETCCAAAEALGALEDERAIPVLAARLFFDPEQLKGKRKKGKRARKRALALQESAASALGKLGRDALIAVLKAARSDNPTARRGAAIALGHIGGGRALAALDRAVSDAEDSVREAAAEALEQVAGSDVTRLKRMLQNDDDRVRVRAIHALSKLDDLRSLDLLLRAYGDPSKQVNKAVVEALAKREGKRAHSILIAAAAGGNATAIHALVENPVRQAIPALLEALDSPWYEVYSEALEAIRAYVEVFDGDSPDDREAMAALRQAVPELTYLLHDESAKARRLALQGLTAFGDPGTVPDIAYLLQDSKEDIRFAAVHALQAIGGTEAVSALQAGYAEAEDEDLRTEIADALKQMEAAQPGNRSPEPV